MSRSLFFVAAFLFSADCAGAADAEKRRMLEVEIAALETSAKAMTPEFEAEMHEWESGLHLPVKWEALAVLGARSRHGKLEPQPDGSLKAPPNLAEKEVYSIRATTMLKGITAVRVEALLEAGTVGRTGNAVLTEFRVDAAPINAATKAGARGNPGDVLSLKFSAASADFSQKGSGPHLTLDGDPKTGWSFGGATDKPHAAVFELSKPPDTGAGSVLTIVMWQEVAMQNLNRVRVSVTTKAPPVCELPESIRQAIALEPSERSEAQRIELIDSFRPMSKAYAAVMKTIAEKRAELAQLQPIERWSIPRRK